MNNQSSQGSAQDPKYLDAVDSVAATLEQLNGCPSTERERLKSDIADLTKMYDKVTSGRVEIAIFGEISTGKSAMINALIGRAVAEVNVQGGWTKQIWGTNWDGSGHVIPGFEKSEVIIIDTPGINEVEGADRAELAETTARQSDLILFVTDSDLNDTEYAALVELAAVQKPLILVFNKIDLYREKNYDALLEQEVKKQIEKELYENLENQFGNVLFFSAKEKENLEDFKGMLTTKIKDMYNKSYPYQVKSYW